MCHKPAKTFAILAGCFGRSNPLIHHKTVKRPKKERFWNDTEWPPDFTTVEKLAGLC
ncbi:hypothetical protein LCGC14_0796930 [marine sediment metagenome]|uniref:Uncharacterized protein n=1 Tax=marine sediment metagenome TaxID=412755 RepID=A0A0F9SXZ3_9ZZZZ